MLVLAKADATRDDRRRRLSAVHQPLGQRRGRARRLSADRGFRARRHDPGLAVPLRRARRRAAHLDGAGRRHGLCRLAAATAMAPSVAVGLPFSPTAATITARPGPTGSSPRSPPTGARLTGHRAGPLCPDDRRRPAGRSRRGGDWYWNFALPVERERGLGDRDAHLHVGDAAAAAASRELGRVRRQTSAPSPPDLDAALERRRAWDRAVRRAGGRRRPDLCRRRRTG